MRSVVFEVFRDLMLGISRLKGRDITRVIGGLRGEGERADVPA